LHLLRRVTPVTIATSALIVSLILACGAGIPHFIRYVMDYRGSDYTLLHISDPYWSSMVAIDQRYPAAYLAKMCWIVLPIAAVLLIINLVIAAPALAQVRIARPPRVEEEEAARRKIGEGEPTPTGPWGG
jgi:hypothetical protein